MNCEAFVGAVGKQVNCGAGEGHTIMIHYKEKLQLSPLFKNITNETWSSSKMLMGRSGRYRGRIIVDTYL